MRAYAPFRPCGLGGSTARVVPPLTVYVFVAGVPPSVPGEAVTFTSAVLSGATRESVAPLARLSATVARSPTAAVAGMNAVS
ncbi:hypothetical protein SALBM135S_01745 [Streptomyces alboniger]